MFIFLYIHPEQLFRTRATISHEYFSETQYETPVRNKIKSAATFRTTNKINSWRNRVTRELARGRWKLSQKNIVRRNWLRWKLSQKNSDTNTSKWRRLTRRVLHNNQSWRPTDRPKVRNEKKCIELTLLFRCARFYTIATFSLFAFIRRHRFKKWTKTFLLKS